MPTFAKLDDNDIVIDVIVAEQSVIDSGDAGDPSKFIQTSRNTMAGQHLNGKEPLRKNYAGIGYKYNREHDAFVPTKIYDSWELNHETCVWEPPVPCPNEDDKYYKWDEENLCWLEYDMPKDDS